jgi:hypothetical protein
LHGDPPRFAPTDRLTVFVLLSLGAKVLGDALIGLGR